MSATQARKRFGQLCDTVQGEPVRVQRYGRNAVVMVDAKEFDQLSAIEDAVWGLRAIEAEKRGKASPAEVQALLDRFVYEAVE